MLCGKSLVKKSCFTNSFPRYLHIFYERRKIITYMCVCHDFIDLLCYTLFYFFCSTKTSTCNNYSYQKYNQETKNNSSFSKHQCLKFVCLSSQKNKTKNNNKQTKKKKKKCQTNAKHLNIFVSHTLETGQSA